MLNNFLIIIISNIFQLLNLLIIIRVLLSWFNYNSYNQLTQLLFQITEPILSPFRNIFSSMKIGIDFSPLVAIFVLDIMKNIIVTILYRL